ncbi:MAG: hypothetical protein ACKORE_04600, partial [Bacteroidota bacterium]
MNHRVFAVRIFNIMFMVFFPVVICAQTVIFQSGFETGDPTFAYAVGPVNTPVLAATGGNTAPACGSFSINGKYDGAFISTNTMNFLAGKYYQISYAYRMANCFGSASVYRNNTG